MTYTLVGRLDEYGRLVLTVPPEETRRLERKEAARRTRLRLWARKRRAARVAGELYVEDYELSPDILEAQ